MHTSARPCAKPTPLVFLLSLIVFFVSPTWAEESVFTDAIDYSEVSSGTLFLSNNHGNTNATALTTEVRVDISGMVSKVRFEQAFENLSNDWVEGVYTFPLPDQAAVHSLIVTVGDRRIVGRVKENKQAEKIYQQAKSAGKVASLVKQQRPNLFSSKIANIGPGEKISITLEYIQTVSLTNERYGLNIPLTLTPRYGVPPTDAKPVFTSASSVENIDEFGQMDSHRVTISGTLHGALGQNSVISPSHGLRIQTEDNAVSFELSEQAMLDRDFIVQWTQGANEVPAINAWRETVNGEDFLLAAITPPKDAKAIPDLMRELVIVIDTSGSMAGLSIRAAKSAVSDALLGLTERDTFNIIEFNDQYSSLFLSPRQATLENLNLGQSFTNRLVADGGTEMLPALKKALAHGSDNRLRQIVFITDGAVGFEDSVIESVTRRLKNARLFTVGIGSAPNQWFMKKVAQAGRGTSHFIASVSDVSTEMDALLSTLETPAVTDMVVSFGSSAVEFMPNPTPDLYVGKPIIVAAKLDGKTTTMKASGLWGQESWIQTLDLTQLPVVNTGLSTIWARRKIESLEDEQRFQDDPDFFKSLITRIALNHQILSKYTSFVAVDETPVRPLNTPLKETTTPNLLPHGTRTQSVSFPNGNADSDRYLQLALMLLMISAFVWYSQSRTER